MEISPLNAIEPAFKRMQKILFAEFDPGKWLFLGFCSFLAQLGSGGGCSYNPGVKPESLEKLGNFSDTASIREWFLANLAWIALAGAALFLLILILTVMLLWLSSRGKFMLLDNVVRNAANVAQPWREYKTAGNRLFGLQLILMVIVGGIFLLLLGGGTALAWPYFAIGESVVLIVPFLIIGGLFFLVTSIVFVIIFQLLNDFIVPIMYQRGLTVSVAAMLFQRELLSGHATPFVVFYLLKIALSIVAGIITLIGTCLTCCLAAVPFISSVVFLPIAVFFRGYSLYFLEQFGDQWRLIAPESPTL